MLLLKKINQHAALNNATASENNDNTIAMSRSLQNVMKSVSLFTLLKVGQKVARELVWPEKWNLIRQEMGSVLEFVMSVSMNKCKTP